MNRFQAMAQCMAILGDGGHLKPGTRKYKIARELIAAKIDMIGPTATLNQVRTWKGHLLDEIDRRDRLSRFEEKIPFKGI